ncbi:hypothetical protein [Actinacidiphila rubida]|nr:hypothetical protein [Actinacidiphila rubida]
MEQRLGTSMLHRRLVRDYESNPQTSKSRVYQSFCASVQKA